MYQIDYYYRDIHQWSSPAGIQRLYSLGNPLQRRGLYCRREFLGLLCKATLPHGILGLV